MILNNGIHSTNKSTNDKDNTSSSSSQLYTSHAVSRSNEFLSCARTALKLLQQSSSDNPSLLSEELRSLSPSALTLHQSYEEEEDSSGTSDASTLLSALDTSVQTLTTLVRRRGHTNDPTTEIQSLMSAFQSDAQDLTEVVKSVHHYGTLPIDGKRSSGQRKRHYELVSDGLQKMASERAEVFKKALEVRSAVIRDQANRRRMLNPARVAASSGVGNGGSKSLNSSSVSSAMGGIRGTSGGGGGVSAAKVRLDSPLFTMTQSSTGAAAYTHSAPSSGSGKAVLGGAGGPPVKSASTIGTTTTTNYTNNGGYYGGGNNNTSSAYGSYASTATPNYTTAATASSYGGGGGYTTTASSYGGAGAGGGYGGYGGYGGAAYGGGGGSGGNQNLGMRKRPGATATGTNDSNNNNTSSSYYYPNNNPQSSTITAEETRAQIQTRRTQRDTRSRLESQRQVEKSIAEVGKMFSKMATLVSSQAETVERIEQDMEAAHEDVDAGAKEIEKLYEITKGNRGLILKVFAILIFFVVFMKFY